jgi:hypothetical protein
MGKDFNRGIRGWGGNPKGVHGDQPRVDCLQATLGQRSKMTANPNVGCIIRVRLQPLQGWKCFLYADPA